MTSDLPSRPRRPARRLAPGGAALALVLLAPWRPAGAQIPGLPVAANAFIRPGGAVGVNGGRGDGRSTFGLAATYGHGGGLFAVTAGAAAFDGEELGGGRTEAAWGVRALARGLSLADGRAGVAPFVGIGGVSAGSAAADAGGEAVGTRAMLSVPVGAVASWRTSVGGGRAIAASIAPFASWNRQSEGDDERSATLLRFSAAVDVAVTRRAGVTLAWEGGASAATDAPGPRGSILGLGISFGFGGR